MPNVDFIIIGAGIVGLATAMRLQERAPHAAITVIEKEGAVGVHQSGHNSGVIHAGVYYQPGSDKARLCREGLTQTVAFCRQHAIPYKQCGKLIVAINAKELARLMQLSQRARQNGVQSRFLNQPELRQLEPNIKGCGALWIRETGIVDYAAMCRKMADVFIARGGEVLLGRCLVGMREQATQVNLETNVETFCARHVIACAGLHADRVAKLAGLETDFAILPFRGDFYELSSRQANVVSHLIYPVPDPSLPFLGIHLTMMIDGGLMVGPSAMLALHREGYEKYSVCLRDLLEMVRYRGLWRLLARYPLAGLSEFTHALSRRVYLRAIRRYCPTIELEDLAVHRSGIRAQAVALDGKLIHDFLIKRTSRMTHICNAPSPAATAALPIADSIIDSLGVC